MQTFSDHLFTTSVFNKPLVIEDKEAILTLVIRLILMEPGTMSFIPDAGVGLVSKYRYLNSDMIPTLEENIENQIIKFLPYFKSVDVQITMDSNKILFIELNLDDNLFTLKSTISKNNEISLSSLM